MTDSPMQKVIVIVGPTAVGKTNMSINVAKAFNGEIISGDSMQIYKQMDIGTAKITKEEMDGIPHHLIDIKEPHEPFSVAEFQRLVREKILEITSENKTPIIVGGTGLYIQSVLYDYQFPQIAGDLSLRARLEDRVNNGEGSELYKQLQKIDPRSAETIHPNNTRRVIRALEIYYTSGQTMSSYLEKQEKIILYQAALVGLTMDRKMLYERINHRVDAMMQDGLLEEVESLLHDGVSKNAQSMKAIGYREIIDYLAGKITLEKAVEQLKKNSRHYAKRQMTWFKNKMDVEWFDMTENGEHFIKTEQVIDFIAGKLQIKSNT